MSLITHVITKQHLFQLLQEAQNASNGPNYSVILFIEPGNLNCTNASEICLSLSKNYKRIKFLHVDNATDDEITTQYNVSVFPTVLLMKGTQELDRLSDILQLEEKLEEIVGEINRSTTSKLDDNTKQSSLSNQLYSLDSMIAKNQCECLNEHDSHNLNNLLSSDSGYLMSDTDEQLIVYISFRQFVRIQALQINGPKSNGPREIKLFINQTSTPDFDSCEIGQPTQEFELSEEDIEDGHIVQLKFVKFQNVNSLTIYVQSNQTNQELTRIDKLKFFGLPVNTTNMNEFKRVSGKQGEAHG